MKKTIQMTINTLCEVDVHEILIFFPINKSLKFRFFNNNFFLNFLNNFHLRIKPICGVFFITTSFVGFFITPF